MLGGEGEVEGVEGRADQVRVVMLKSQVSLSGEEGEESPEQIMILPWGSCGEEALPIREGSLAIVDVSCSLYDALLDALV